uniref:Uncharacterized protein n=1 Tax=Mycena chlorophos TaxID=658473 RepID=A0ABQ0LEV4_MYCCL|nr:predicted protein [Mycena chlorophos]
MQPFMPDPSEYTFHLVRSAASSAMAAFLLLAICVLMRGGVRAILRTDGIFSKAFGGCGRARMSEYMGVSSVGWRGVARPSPGSGPPRGFALFIWLEEDIRTVEHLWDAYGEEFGCPARGDGVVAEAQVAARSRDRLCCRIGCLYPPARNIDELILGWAEGAVVVVGPVLGPVCAQ